MYYLLLAIHPIAHNLLLVPPLEQMGHLKNVRADVKEKRLERRVSQYSIHAR